MISLFMVLQEFHKKTFKFNKVTDFLQTPLVNPLVFTMPLVCTLLKEAVTVSLTKNHEQKAGDVRVSTQRIREHY